MKQRTAFTIVELLVVISIIAILMGILLPAIASSRDQAQTTRSLANLRQLAVAHATYASEWNDNQWTVAPHNLASYGKSLSEAVANYQKSLGNQSKSVSFDPKTGFAGVPAGSNGTSNVIWTAQNSHDAIVPIALKPSDRRFGYFRMINARPFNQYLGGRFYDDVFFAPKDITVLETIGECIDAPGEFCSLSQGAFGPVSSSYILSAAALYTPAAWSGQFVSDQMMWQMPALLRTPTFSQARYPELKTHMLEHHWLQDNRRAGPCIPNPKHFMKEYTDDCAPYFYNASMASMPATLFYDGHVELLSVHEVHLANKSMMSQSKSNLKLWHTGTPLGPPGYFENYAHQKVAESVPNSSFHVLTRDGILGRDTLAR